MTNDERRFIIDLMRWSFSRVNSFNNCRYEWMLKYIEEPGENADSCYGQFGTLCHKILEEYAKGKLDLLELPIVYEERFKDTITEDFPRRGDKDFRSDYYEKGYEYFLNFSGFGDEYEILGVEKKVEFELEGYPFIGFIDLLMKNKNTGEIVILDHKSTSMKFKKDGSLSKTSLPKFEEFRRQLYLYSIPIIKEYGHVDKLTWNLFKDGTSITIDFDYHELDSARNWALKTIKEIENETKWEAKPDYMYCSYLCSKRRDGCPYKFQLPDREEYVPE